MPYNSLDTQEKFPKCSSSHDFVSSGPGAPCSGLWYLGLEVASVLQFILDTQPFTFDFQLLIPARYFFSAKSFQYYRILLNSCH